MIHFLWSIFFLVLTMALVLAYVAAFASVLFMVHFIAIHDWRDMAADDRVTSDRMIFIGGKFFLYLLIAAGIAFCVDYIDYRFFNYGVTGYQHSAVAAAASRDILIFFMIFILFLVINTLKIQRNLIAGTSFSHYYHTSLFRKMIVACLVCMLSVYVIQLQKWTGKDNANLEAKQYWVAGQVLNGFRLVLTTFIHPEIPIMVPANLLQQWIYNKGTQYLPANDGEIGVWQNSWFHYHYSKRGRKPLYIRGGKPSDLMVKLLDQEWFCLQTMATKPFADSQMKEEHYYRDYVSLALSYSFYKGYYSGWLTGSSSRMAQMPEHVQRTRQLSQWLWDLHEKWQKSQKMKTFLQEHPKLEVMYQLVQSLELSALIQGEIYARTFDCNNQSISRYITIRKNFYERSPGHLPPYLRMKDKKQRDWIYYMIISQTGARSTKYVITHYCGYEVAGKEDIKIYEDSYLSGKMKNMTLTEKAEQAAKDNYMDEIKILKEMYHK